MEVDKYEIKRSFDQSTKLKEDQDLARFYYNWSQLFCVKFFKKENEISIKNKFYYSVKLCQISQADERMRQFLQGLVFRIYIHPMETKPDLEKDYVYKYVYRQEERYSEVNIHFMRTESLLLPRPYWTECKNAIYRNFSSTDIVD